MFGIKTKLKKFYNRIFYYPFVWEKYLRRRERELQRKDVITVAFVTMNISMWKYQYLYDLLKKNSRFKLYIIISPSVKFSHNVMVKDAQLMRQYFSERNMEYIDWDLEHGAFPVSIKDTINPDILFYTQPYKNVFTRNHSYYLFKDKLIGYIPYAFYSLNIESIYNLPMVNNAWKVYYSTETQLKLAQKYAENKGRNVVVTGYADYDRFVQSQKFDVWKIKNRIIKRIIWAPHFSIRKASSIKGFAPRSNFLELADFMLDISEKYAGVLQIAFKPHPRLLTELYDHPDWGKEKADNYYKKWKEMPYGQLETGDFVNLFYFSDALIHDSGSFVMDYLYFDKPQLFLTKDVNIQKKEADKIARIAYDSIYIGYSHDSIEVFIKDVVIKGEDVKSEMRKKLVYDYLLPPCGKFASQNIYDDILSSLTNG